MIYRYGEFEKYGYKHFSVVVGILVIIKEVLGP